MTHSLFKTISTNRRLENELSLDTKSAIYRYFELPSRGFQSRALLGVTKLYTDYRVSQKHWDSWNYIADGLILGKLPYLEECDDIIEYAKTTVGDEKQYQKMPLGLIVSVVDYFELGGNALLDTIATPLNWNKKNIQHYSLPMADFGADVPTEAIIHTIDAMRTCILNNQSVYIHCKAGRGRSAMLSAIYLAIYDPECVDKDAKYALDKSIVKIKSKRGHIVIDHEKYNKALESIKKIQKIKTNIHQSLRFEPLVALEEKKRETPDIKHKLNGLLANTQTKVDIAQLSSFKEFAIYGASILGSSNRTKLIKNLFNKIHKAENADWYLYYQNELKELLDAKPVISKTESNFFGLPEEDQTRREQLCKNLYHDITKYICNKLVCDEEKLYALSKIDSDIMPVKHTLA